MKVTYPQLIDRVQSTVIDTLLVIALLVVFTTVLERFDNVPDWVRAVLFIGIFVVYEPICTTIGCTLGNYIKGIRVRKDTDPTQRIYILQALIRYSIKLILGWISFLPINSNSQKRAIHDLVSGSVMIKL